MKAPEGELLVGTLFFSDKFERVSRNRNLPLTL
jgi:hypothetical protein